MITITAAALALTIASAPDNVIVEASGDQHSVMLDGERITYRSGTDSKGRRHVWGERISDGKSFHFRVDRHGRGRGEVGHKEVKFRVR